MQMRFERGLFLSVEEGDAAGLFFCFSFSICRVVTTTAMC